MSDFSFLISQLQTKNFSSSFAKSFDLNKVLERRARSKEYQSILSHLKDKLQNAKYVGSKPSDTGGVFVAKYSVPKIQKLKIMKVRIPTQTIAHKEVPHLFDLVLERILVETKIVKDSRDYWKPTSAPSIMLGSILGSSAVSEQRKAGAMILIEEAGFSGELMKVFNDADGINAAHNNAISHEIKYNLGKVRPILQTLLRRGVSREELLHLLDEEIVRSIQDYLMGFYKDLEIERYDDLEFLNRMGKPTGGARNDCGGDDMDLIAMLDDMEKAQTKEAEMIANAMMSVPEVPADEVPAEEVAPTAEEVAQAIIPPQVAYQYKGMRYTLLLQGVCSHCAHCGQPLTDSESIERGIGPICTKKGYLDDIPPVDDTEALLALVEYPVLVQWLTQKYKPAGNRGLVNGLTRCASLNRRSPVHAACCDAIEALGYKRLASSLRESIAVVEVSKLDDHNLKVWVKKSEWNWNWTNDMRRIPGTYFSRQHKGTVVPVDRKRDLWELIKKHYHGLACKTETGTVKIPDPS